MQVKAIRRLVQVIVVTLISIFAVSGVLAQSAGYTLDWFVIAGGGQASGGAYTLRSVAGQSTAGPLSGGAYNLTGGFLQAETPPQIYLPVTIR